MKGYRKILIALDGTSREGVAKGLRLAKEERCWITVVKVVPPHEGDLDLVGVRNIDAVLDGGGVKALEEAQGIAHAEGALIKTRLEAGEAHKRIVEVAEEERCDLIIMGAQKMKRGLRRLFGGSIVEKVTSNAPCPVLVVGA